MAYEGVLVVRGWMREGFYVLVWVNLLVTMVSEPCNEPNVSSSNLGEEPTPTKGAFQIHQPVKCQPLKEGHLLNDFVSLYELTFS